MYALIGLYHHQHLNIQITDNQLKAYINRFDQLRGNSTKIQEKDLFKYSLPQLIKLVTSSKGVEEPEDAVDVTPDVVYNENGLIIYNGSKEDNCLTFGAGERWCITRGSFGNYRYDSNRKNPTFYLVKDTNLPSSDKKSFFVPQGPVMLPAVSIRTQSSFLNQSRSDSCISKSSSSIKPLHTLTARPDK